MQIVLLGMTHFQDVFIRNLRFYRTQAGYSQQKFSDLIDLTPNYLNAVENGKYFPSPEVIDRICENLSLLPYQLFLEQPESPAYQHNSKKVYVSKALANLKKSFNTEIDGIISGIVGNNIG